MRSVQRWARVCIAYVFSVSALYFAHTQPSPPLSRSSPPPDPSSPAAGSTAAVPPLRAPGAEPAVEPAPAKQRRPRSPTFFSGGGGFPPLQEATAPPLPHPVLHLRSLPSPPRSAGAATLQICGEVHLFVPSPPKSPSSPATSLIPSLAPTAASVGSFEMRALLCCQRRHHPPDLSSRGAFLLSAAPNAAADAPSLNQRQPAILPNQRHRRPRPQGRTSDGPPACPCFFKGRRCDSTSLSHIPGNPRRSSQRPCSGLVACRF
ncbi:hypothetical protein PVAP13_1KG350600 [Panicum virgatum]|uniref:Uncharacterized protein n=1 Tax=Panicum virgatum TaxID=38727 RepID=A0A8T0XHH9_PANVG|nr:hypothetical protein PVAP13_1KG350600 [Panicum virgatum]KAG2658348.1 hypothetical protein PVAP13_1KG350600 [Panicum virgatum]KAG2658349.1 hypothetical protein PVAP13_1KG350600 [Panicum virgatum]